MGTVDYGELKLDLLRSWRLRRDDVTLHVATRQQRLIASLAIRGASLRAHLHGQLGVLRLDPMGVDLLQK